MLRIHAVLCLSTGSLEMSVFQTLFAGKIGQFARVAAGALTRRALPLPAPVTGAAASAGWPESPGAAAILACCPAGAAWSDWEAWSDWAGGGLAAAPPHAARRLAESTSSNGLM